MRRDIQVRTHRNQSDLAHKLLGGGQPVVVGEGYSTMAMYDGEDATCNGRISLGHCEP